MAARENQRRFRAVPGEFVEIEDGVAHVLSYIETWEEAPAGAIPLREIMLLGMSMPLTELQKRIVSDRGFGELESEYTQAILHEPISSEWINEDNGLGPISFLTTREFLDLRPEQNGRRYCFVVFSPGGITADERERIVSSHSADGRPAAEWLEDYVAAHPELDSPWMSEDILEMLDAKGGETE